ncbi:unnamed protein product [Leptosia nina]|uniref:Cytochrome P450 n=1 Tax=Leptosia nina TaxID=320188 RepID=A0AAV1JUA5_9NEOP
MEYETTLGVNEKAKDHITGKFINAFEDYCNVATNLAFKPWFFMIDGVFKRIKDYDILTSNKKIMSDIVNEAISYKRKVMKQRKNSINSDNYPDLECEKQFSILDSLLANHGDTITDLELLEEILVLALAGTDTTTVTACFSALLLAEHPEIQEKIYQEIERVLGDTTRPIPYDDLPKLKYLDAVIKETLRLYPSAPLIGRLADRDVTLPSGKTIPKGTTMAITIWGMQRNPKFWGEDAHLFNPDRFMNGDLPHPAAYLPFSYGPRNCIVSTDPDTIEYVSKECLEKPEVVCLLGRHITGNGSVFAPETGFGMTDFVNKENNDKFFNALAIYLKVAVDIGFKPWLYMFQTIFERTNEYKILQENRAILFTVINEVISYKRQKKLNNIDAPGENGQFTIIDYLMDHLSNEELFEEIIVMAVAGTDTSAVTSSFTTLMLAKHPDVQDRVYQEVKEVMGDTIRPLNSNDLAQMKFLEAVLKETLRLYPPGPLIGRMIDRDITLPSGITLAKGTSFGFSIWGLHRHPKYWGEDANTFNPDRFMNGYPTHPTAFIPFSCGPRNCVGYKFAMVSIKTMMANFIHRYEVLPAASTDLNQPLRLEFKMMMRDVHNFPIKLKQRTV